MVGKFSGCLIKLWKITVRESILVLMQGVWHEHGERVAHNHPRHHLTRVWYGFIRSLAILGWVGLSHLELLGTMSRSRLDWGSSDFVNRSGVHDVRNLYVDRLSSFAFHLCLQGGDGPQISWPHVPRMSEIHRLPNLRSVYPRSPWLWLLLRDTRPEELDPELPRHRVSSSQLCSVWTKPTGVCASD